MSEEAIQKVLDKLVALRRRDPNAFGHIVWLINLAWRLTQN